MTATLTGACECGLGYARDYPPDVRLHRRVHDAWQHGVKLPPLKGERVVSSAGEIEVLLVDPSASMTERKRAAKVGSMANRETHYDFGVYSPYDGDERGYDTHVYLARLNGRAGAILVTRERRRFWKMSWPEYDQRKNDVPTVEEAKRTLDFIWTHRDHRRHGVATVLIRAAAEHHGLTLDAFAWGAPFEPDGEALARRLAPGVLHLAAD